LFNAPTTELTAIYYGMIAEIDKWIGDIAARLKDAGLHENTMIVFTSDHGELILWMRYLLLSHNPLLNFLASYPVSPF